MGELERQAPGGPPKQITQAEYQRILDTRAVVGRPAAKRKRLKPCWALAVLAVLAAGALAGYNALVGSWEAQPDLVAIADECFDLGYIDRENVLVELAEERRDRLDFGSLDTGAGRAEYELWLAAAAELGAYHSRYADACNWALDTNLLQEAGGMQIIEQNQRIVDTMRAACREATRGAEWC